MKNSRGQAGGLSGSIISLGIATIVLVMILVIMQGMRDTPLVKSPYSASFANESLADASTRTVSCASFPGAACSFGLVINQTGNQVIPSTNYTVSGCSLIELAGPYSARPWNASYTCTYGGESYTAGNNTIVGIGTFGSFWTIIVLAVVGAVVIGIIFGAFGGVGRRAR